MFYFIDPRARKQYAELERVYPQLFRALEESFRPNKVPRPEVVTGDLTLMRQFAEAFSQWPLLGNEFAARGLPGSTGSLLAESSTHLDRGLSLGAAAGVSVAKAVEPFKGVTTSSTQIVRAIEQAAALRRTATPKFLSGPLPDVDLPLGLTLPTDTVSRLEIRRSWDSLSYAVLIPYRVPGPKWPADGFLVVVLDSATHEVRQILFPSESASKAPSPTVQYPVATRAHVLPVLEAPAELGLGGHGSWVVVWQEVSPNLGQDEHNHPNWTPYLKLRQVTQQLQFSGPPQELTNTQIPGIQHFQWLRGAGIAPISGQVALFWEEYKWLRYYDPPVVHPGWVLGEAYEPGDRWQTRLHLSKVSTAGDFLQDQIVRETTPSPPILGVSPIEHVGSGELVSGWNIWRGEIAIPALHVELGWGESFWRIAALNSRGAITKDWWNFGFCQPKVRSLKLGLLADSLVVLFQTCESDPRDRRVYHQVFAFDGKPLTQITPVVSVGKSFGQTVPALATGVWVEGSALRQYYAVAWMELAEATPGKVLPNAQIPGSRCYGTPLGGGPPGLGRPHVELWRFDGPGALSQCDAAILSAHGCASPARNPSWNVGSAATSFDGDGFMGPSALSVTLMGPPFPHTRVAAVFNVEPSMAPLGQGGVRVAFRYLDPKY